MNILVTLMEFFIILWFLDIIDTRVHAHLLWQSCVSDIIEYQLGLEKHLFLFRSS